MSAIRAAAKKTFRSLCALGPRSTSELVWARPALEALPLERDLEWAGYWLSGHAVRINSFRDFAAALQEQVLAGELATAKSSLDSFVRAAGWSLWAVELRAALLQIAEGTSAQRAWFSELQAKSVSSIPGLLFQIFGDRNDDTFSYDAIHGKCMSSFPRFESMAPWLVDYLKFRALAQVDEARKALPGILSRDITSSLIDYYEDVVETLICIETKPELADLRSAASKLALSLIGEGYQDHRLHKLSVAFTAEFSREAEIHVRPKEAYREVYRRRTVGLFREALKWQVAKGQKRSRLPCDPRSIRG